MKTIHRLINFLDSLSSQRFLIAVFIVQVVTHVRYLDYPPVGFHQWRQTQTLSVARSFYEEDMNILHPRSDNRGNTSGITGMEFPVVNYIIALGYKAFGFNNYIPRIVILFFSYLALIGCFLFTKKLLKSRWLASVATIILMFSPLFCYYSIVVLPDIPALAFVFLSLFYFLEYKESGKTSTYIMLIISLSLSALIKAYAFIVLPFMLYEILKSNKTVSKKIVDFSGIALSILIVGGWYLYARYLSEITQIFDYKLNSSFPYDLAVVSAVLKKVFLQWLPELYISYAEFILFCFGIYALIKKNYPISLRFILLYLGVLIIYMITFFPMFEIHDYYAMPTLPILILIATLGFGYLVIQAESKKWISTFILILIIVIPLLGSVRALSRLEGAKQSEDLLTIEKHLDNLLPDKNSLFIAAGDESPSIYFYFMHRKGWAINKSLSESQLLKMKTDGAKYFVSTHRDLEQKPEISKHLVLISQLGSFNIFSIKD